MTANRSILVCIEENLTTVLAILMSLPVLTPAQCIYKAGLV